MIVNRLKSFVGKSKFITSVLSILRPNFNHNISFYLKNSNFNFTNNNTLNKLKEREEGILKEDIENVLETFKQKQNTLFNQKIKSYKELKKLHNEKQDYLEKLRLNFEDLRQLFIKKNEEIEMVRSRMEKSVQQVKNEAATKFSKDLLVVIDELLKMENTNEINKKEILVSKDKDTIYRNMLEGISFNTYFIHI